MGVRQWKAFIAVFIAIVVWSPGSFAQELAPIQLPAPQRAGGMSLLQALDLRATSRAFAADPLPLQTLSNLLWASWGINRPDTKKRTAPSAMNWQEIELFAVMEKGIYLYDAVAHALQPVAGGDFRALTGKQEFVKEAPLTLVMVADLTRMGQAPAEQKEGFAMADAAFISQNAYLFSASAGLVTGVRALIDKPALAKAMKLADSQIIIFAQTIGFPKR